MFTSNKFKIAVIIAAVAAESIASPAFAQSRDGASKDRQIVRQHQEPTGRNAFGMAVGSISQLDPNSPAATGGGSLGYNRNLLEY